MAKGKGVKKLEKRRMARQHVRPGGEELNPPLV